MTQETLKTESGYSLALRSNGAATAENVVTDGYQARRKIAMFSHLLGQAGDFLEVRTDSPFEVLTEYHVQVRQRGAAYRLKGNQE